MQIISSNSVITNINCIKFLGLNIDSTLSWKDHITALSSRLNKACYALRAIKLFMSIDVMKSIYYSYVHCILCYFIIFWGNSHLSDSIFNIKKMIRVITISGKYDSCHELFKKLQNYFSLNIFFHFLFLSSRAEFALYLIRISMILIHDSTKTYICPLQI
jgi:hypothetical protein